MGFQIKDILTGKFNKYQIKEFLGEGSYGKVAKCVKLSTEECIAIKIVQRTWPGLKEVSVHDKLKHLDKNKNNLVRCIEHFIHKGHVCLAFEMLDISLYDLMKVRSFQPLCLSEIRVISQQMLVALNALKSIGLAHADIKPDNVMLVNHQLHPFKLKLIDFGLATPVSSMHSGSIIQVVNYRAPEVILGLPLNEAVDMWSLGCLLAYMYLGMPLFPTQCESEVMRVIIQMRGQPDDHLLSAGIHTKKYFSKDQNFSDATWKLNESVQGWSLFNSLDDIAKTGSEKKNIMQYEDTQAFLSLLKHMLHVDPEKRITPSEALGHRFVTTKHFKDCTNKDKYVKSAHLTIKNCQLEQSSVKFKHFVTSSEVISCNGASVTKPLLAVVKPSADTDNGPPAKAALDDTTTVGTDKTPPSGKNEAVSPVPVNPESDGINTIYEEGTTGFVEVKTRKKWCKRMCNFFNSVCCCREDPVK